MELLILVALATWAAAGPVGHWRKTEPLRIAARRQQSAQAHERRMASIGRRGGRPTIPEAISMRIADRIAHPRGGPARTALAEWWADSWLYATDRRRERHARAAAGQLRRQRAAKAVTRRLREKKRQWRAQGGPKRPHNDPWARPRPHHLHVDTAMPVWTASPAAGAEANDIVEPELAEAELVEAAPVKPAFAEPAFADADAGNQYPGAATRDRDGDTVTSRTGAAPRALASVHPLRSTGIHHPRKDVAMTLQTTGETLDPAAGRAFVDSVRESTEQIRAQIELSSASLTGRGVSGEPIELLTAISEAFSLAVTACERAAAHFERHLGIQDQVLADPTLAGSVQNTYIGQRS